MSSPIRRSCFAAIAAVATWCAASAQASDVHWSVGINAPIGPGVSVGTVISNRHVVPVIVAPAPVYLPPAVVYAPPPRVVYAPPPVIYAPRPVVWGAPVWVGGRWVRHPYQHPAHGWHGGYDHGRRDDHRGPPQYVPRRPGREIRY